jgi:hypothetical protein
MEWTIVNIVVPIFAPIIGILALKLLFLPPAVVPLTDPMLLVKDGQLGWVSVAICCAALGEYNETNDALFTAHDAIPGGWHTLSWTIVLSLIFSALTAVWGAVFNTPILAPPAAKPHMWFGHYKTFVSSVLWTTAAAASFIVLHFYYVLPPRGVH